MVTSSAGAVGGMRAVAGAIDSQSAAFVDAITAGLRGHPARMQKLLRATLRNPPTALKTNPGLLEGLHAAVSTITAGGTAPGVVPGAPGPAAPLPTGSRRLVDAAHELALAEGLDVDRDPVITPALEPDVHQIVTALVAEHRSESLAALGISPTRTLLLTGDPGTGKTITARWIAAQLDRPLLRLDLAAVMDRALGRSAQNLVGALESAAEAEAVLFIDEFDAIASARASSSDIGEIRRLVNVLLLGLDAWPPDHLLIAATNHPQLLDPAVHRRFEVRVSLTKPSRGVREQIWRSQLAHLPEPDVALLAALSTEWFGSDIATCALRVKRAAGLHARTPTLDDALGVMRQAGLTRASQSAAIDELVARGYEAGAIAAMVGVSITAVQTAISDRDDDARSHGGTR